MLTISVINENKEILAQTSDDTYAQLLYTQNYAQGDCICVQTDEVNTCLVVQLEDTMPQTMVYVAQGEYTLPIPFAEQKNSYNPKSFTGDYHFIAVRKATVLEMQQHIDLACNPYDHHANTAFYPHVKANVETRGEAVFAARNAVDGNTANHGHGLFPFESWGIQQRADAAFSVHFGREVQCDGIGVTIRCDFPHDNWWHTATVQFSDGSKEVLQLQKTNLPQHFTIAPRKIEWAQLCEMKKDETDPSPFPALTALQVFGYNK